MKLKNIVALALSLTITILSATEVLAGIGTSV
jgi:hypothetical protein